MGIGLAARLGGMTPEWLGRKIFHVGFHAAHDEFLNFAHDYAYAPSMRRGLDRLNRRGLRPSFVADVGAYHGDWSRMARQIWPEAQIAMFEANPEKEADLSAVAQEIDAELSIGLLGPESGSEQTFYVMESGSSVLEENSPLDRTPVTLQTRRLDDVVNARRVDFLKVDVQGFELEVLRGASATLAQAQAVLLEVSLIEVNKGAPLMAEVVAFMAEAGFQVLDVMEIHRRPLDRATNQLDLIFAPDDSPFFTDTRHFA